MAAALHLKAAKTAAWTCNELMTWRWNGVSGFKEITRKLRSPSISEDKGRIIVKKTVQ
jgi:hypothetical protein